MVTSYLIEFHTIVRCFLEFAESERFINTRISYNQNNLLPTSIISFLITFHPVLTLIRVFHIFLFFKILSFPFFFLLFLLLDTHQLLLRLHLSNRRDVIVEFPVILVLVFESLFSLLLFVYFFFLLRKLLFKGISVLFNCVFIALRFVLTKKSLIL